MPSGSESSHPLVGYHRSKDAGGNPIFSRRYPAERKNRCNLPRSVRPMFLAGETSADKNGLSLLKGEGRRVLKSLLEILEKAGSNRTVDDPMICGERHLHRVADNNRAALHHRLFND